MTRLDGWHDWQSGVSEANQTIEGDDNQAGMTDTDDQRRALTM